MAFIRVSGLMERSVAEAPGVVGGQTLVCFGWPPEAGLVPLKWPRQAPGLTTLRLVPTCLNSQDQNGELERFPVN